MGQNWRRRAILDKVDGNSKISRHTRYGETRLRTLWLHAPAIEREKKGRLQWQWQKNSKIMLASMKELESHVTSKAMIAHPAHYRKENEEIFFVNSRWNFPPLSPLSTHHFESSKIMSRSRRLLHILQPIASGIIPTEERKG